MRGYLKELKREWRWLPSKREAGAYIALVVAIVFSKLAISRITITTPEGFYEPLTWNATDELFVIGLLVTSLFAIYAMYRLLRAEAVARRPATARLHTVASSLWILLMTLFIAAPLIISGILIHTATPRYENLTPEEIWTDHQQEPLSREIYDVACQAIVDRDYEMDRPLRQCVDPDAPDALLSLEPSEKAKEFRTIFRNIYHMRHAGIRLLIYWLVGLAIIAFVLVSGRRKRTVRSIDGVPVGHVKSSPE